MRKLLEDLYHGNLAPSAREMAPESKLLQAVGKTANCEERLMEHLNEAEQEILKELIEAQFTMDSITAVENFVIGFRLGARMILECMDDNDGDIREVTDDG